MRSVGRPPVPGQHHRQGGGHGAYAGPSPAGSQGTLGGVTKALGARPGRRQVALGDELYLWILVALEVSIIAWGRRAFKRYHGG